MQKAEESGLRAGSRAYARDPRQERAGPSLPLPQQQPLEGWREASDGARWQGPAAEVRSLLCQHVDELWLALSPSDCKDSQKGKPMRIYASMISLSHVRVGCHI